MTPFLPTAQAIPFHFFPKFFHISRNTADSCSTATPSSPASGRPHQLSTTTVPIYHNDLEFQILKTQLTQRRYEFHQERKMSNTKKYGLQLRVPPSQQKKQPTRPPLRTPIGFEDDNDDSVERDILRQASKNKSLKDIEEQHKKALEEDPSVFDYDGVYDKMKEKSVQPVVQDRQNRKPKYIQALIEKAKIREREHEIIYEKKLAKERSKDEHVYADKDKFVTGAYKKKLAEQAKWLEEERLRELRENKEDVTKKSDISDFYFNLGKNVAFGGGAAISEKLKEKQEETVIQSQESTETAAPSTNASTESSRLIMRQHRETSEDRSSEEKHVKGFAKPASDASTQDQDAAETSTTNQPRPEHHKRSVDAVTAAKERFLARKKAKEQ